MVRSKFTYDEQVTAYAAQGLMNALNMMVFFNIGDMNFDWHKSDTFWKDELEKSGQVQFTMIEPNLCSLVEMASSVNATSGLVVYQGDGQTNTVGDGFSAAVALTLAGQNKWLPVSTQLLRGNPCITATGLAVKEDLTKTLESKSREDVWKWAISNLLQKSSNTTLFSLNHFRQNFDASQSDATASSIDYAVQQNAFVLDLETHSSVSRKGPPLWNQDDEFIEQIFEHMEPLFDAYGWSNDEFTWTNETSHYGGTVMCSFASPNLSFWARLKLKDGASTARKLPKNDRNMRLDHSKYYVTFETNEGDTPRVLISAMVSSWASEDRGSIPISWAIDPLLAERFPSLFDFYASTATMNDSFIAGTAGAGYVFLNQLSEEQLSTYGARVGRLISQYGPDVIDTYGYANISVHEAYKNAILEGGATVDAFVTQPNWSIQDFSPFYCRNNSNMILQDGTPLICTSGRPSLFYYSRGLDNDCPSCDLAKRIEEVARAHSPPYFVLVYGGLQAFGGSDVKSKKNFFPLLKNTIQRLGSEFIVIGANEMSRLSREASRKRIHL